MSARASGPGGSIVPERPRGEAAGVTSVATGSPASLRVGLGRDAHHFGPGLGLRLGGVAFDLAPRLHGHSDGDVVLHAIADALLGGAALGDLGRLFPAGPETPRDADSRELLAAVVGRVRAAGWHPVSLDVTIVGARPKLVGRLDEIGASIAALVGLERERISVKGSTGNLAGMEGAGRGISALATALLEPVPSPGHAVDGGPTGIAEDAR